MSLREEQLAAKRAQLTESLPSQPTAAQAMPPDVVQGPPVPHAQMNVDTGQVTGVATDTGTGPVNFVLNDDDDDDDDEDKALAASVVPLPAEVGMD